MLAQLNADGKYRHLQHAHGGGYRSFADVAGEQRQAHQPGVGEADTKRIDAQSGGHPQVGVGCHHRRHGRQQQSGNDRPAAHDNQRPYAAPGGQAGQHQVTRNQRAEDRHLQQAVLIAAHPFTADNNDRRLGDPRQQRQADKARRQRPGNKAAVFQHRLIVPSQLLQG